MATLRFEEPIGVPLGAGYSLQVQECAVSRTGSPVATVDLFNGVGLYRAELTLTRDDQRRRYVRAAQQRTHEVSADAILDGLIQLAFALAEALRARAATTSAGARPQREQLSLTPPGFVCVALDAAGQRVYVLRRDDGTLEVAPSAVGPYKGETVTHVPPPDLPWVLPQAETIRAHWHDAQEPGWAARLLSDLEAWHHRASDLGRSDAYLLLALYDLLTYVEELTDYLAIILLEAEPERGKSRTGQAMAYVCRHGMHLQGIREANLLRAAGNLQASLFIDLMSAWKTAEREKCTDVLLGRWERGGYVERVTAPEAGPFADTVRYAVFGPTIIATNEPIHRILDTRCLRIDMPLTARRFSGRIRPEEARPLVERLMAWRALMLGAPLPDGEPPVDGRLGDVLRPLSSLLCLIAPERAEEFAAIVSWQQRRKHDDLAQSPEAAIVRAVGACRPHAGRDWLPVARVLEQVNSTRPSEPVRPNWVGRKLRGLGWTVERRGHDNTTAVHWDADLLERLQARYGLTAHLTEMALHAGKGASQTSRASHTVDAADARESAVAQENCGVPTESAEAATRATYATPQLQDDGVSEPHGQAVDEREDAAWF